jgi:hypothetical protein
MQFPKLSIHRRQEMTSFIDKGFAVLETEQSKINKAFFDALTMRQRDTFRQSLADQGVKPAQMERIAGKSHQGSTDI